jgi:hypothetical protein
MTGHIPLISQRYRQDTMREPDSSRHANSEILGKKLTPEKARKHPRLDDFFAVSDFIIDNDPAVLSYLSGQEVDIRDRVCKH